MSGKEIKLLLVVPITNQEDLNFVVEAEEWHTVQDIFKKTGTSFLRDWNGNYVIDLDEIPWKATPEELNALEIIEGKVITITESKYRISTPKKLYKDKQSVYVIETDVTDLFN
ncbi:MAG: hypothetical protein M1511_14955 [Deltaproteobacteria bacterium]|nr:hypothetical protein [Deltaproteobacteria bacterium]